METIAKLKSLVGVQTFAGKTREQVDAALTAQIDVLENNLTEGDIEGKYLEGDDFILGAAESALGGNALGMWPAML